MKLPRQPPTYNSNFEQQRSSAIERAFAEFLATPATISLIDGVSVPNVEAGKALLYVDIADGDLKVKFSDGTVKTIATDT